MTGPAFDRILDALRAAAGGKREHVTRALSALVADGYVTAAPGPRGSTLHTLAKPYRQPQESGDGQPPPNGFDCPRPSERGTGDTHSTAPGGQSGDSGGQSEEGAEPKASASLTCADCGAPVPSGYVRCAACRRLAFGGAQ